MLELLDPEDGPVDLDVVAVLELIGAYYVNHPAGRRKLVSFGAR
jgi:hypothetical protein